MRFLTRKRRQPPAIIIVSLIDILIVLLIFLMVTTTFKQQPALQLALPESKQAKAGASEESLVVTIAAKEPYLYLGERPITLEKLQTELTTAAKANSKISLSIRADTGAPFGEIVKVMDASKSAGVKTVSAFTKAAGK
ncbi:MAG TPA: biopolymer transporter ExbD [Verrucomicrobiae bacterium]|nr:biopolymer transporter ExbD [Verrucomicrobiae bacterium]